MTSATGFWTKFRSYIWDSDAHLKSPEERALVRKLDFGIVNNLANAYISGMKEDLNINGNEKLWLERSDMSPSAWVHATLLRYALVEFKFPYALMQVPSTMIIQKIRPSYYLAFCEVGWGIWTLAQAGAKNSQQTYVFRFMVAGRPIRVRVLSLSLVSDGKLGYSHGSAMSGYLQAAVYKNLDGQAGLAGWRWLYIVCGCMTIPCGILLFFVLPDLPSNCKVWYLSDEEKEFALARAIRNGKGQPTGKIGMALLKRTFSRWHWYWFVLGYILYGSSCAATGYFGIWLKAENFGVSARNVIPSCGSLINILNLPVGIPLRPDGQLVHRTLTSRRAFNFKAACINNALSIGSLTVQTVSGNSRIRSGAASARILRYLRHFFSNASAAEPHQNGFRFCVAGMLTFIVGDQADARDLIVVLTGMAALPQTYLIALVLLWDIFRNAYCEIQEETLEALDSIATFTPPLFADLVAKFKAGSAACQHVEFVAAPDNGVPTFLTFVPADELTNVTAACGGFLCNRAPHRRWIGAEVFFGTPRV
ncbi:major facilitator superfamily domain-containing protein [Mycena latifolia]|nr:major facilitator superfamily domain-containing protein [Mycena latifolia]